MESKKLTIEVIPERYVGSVPYAAPRNIKYVANKITPSVKLSFPGSLDHLIMQVFLCIYSIFE